MRFELKKCSETVTSREQLSSLISGALRNRTVFSLGDGCRRCLQLTAYSEEGATLELHRGKKWSGWISPEINDVAARQLFLEYYESGDLSDATLIGENEWLEFEGFHPAAYVVMGCIMIGLVVYFGFLK